MREIEMDNFRRVFWLGQILLASLVAMLNSGKVNAQDGAKIEIVPNIGHSAAVRAVTFSPDGTLALSGSADHTIKLWNVATGRLMRTFMGHSDVVGSVAFSPDGARVLSGSNDKSVKLWDLATGRLLRTFEGHSSIVTSIAFSPDGAHVISGSNDKSLRLWDAVTGQLLRTFNGHTSLVSSVAFSPDGVLLLSGSGDHTLKLWDAATGELLHSFEGHEGWDPVTGEMVRNFQGHREAVNSVAFSRDGAHILSGGSDMTLLLWETQSRRLVQTFKWSGTIQSVAFSPGTGVFSATGTDAKLWDAATGQLVRTIKLEDLGPDREVRPIRGHAESVTSIAISPDGSRILSASEDETLKLWDVATGELVPRFAGQSGKDTAVIFSPNGARILSARILSVGEYHQPFKLWDATTGQLVHTFDAGILCRF